MWQYLECFSDGRFVVNLPMSSNKRDTTHARDCTVQKLEHACQSYDFISDLGVTFDTRR